METLTTPSQINVNDQLVEIDNLINALHYIKEEAETKLLTSQQAGGIMREYLESDAFFRRVRDYIRNRHLSNIATHVAIDVKEEINSHLENYILSRLDDRIETALEARGV